MAKPVEDEDAERGRQLAEWRARYPEAFGFHLEWDEELGVPVPVSRKEDMVRCNATIRPGELCTKYAGTRTSHLGVGRCWLHDSRVERAAGAWQVAHRIARVMDVTPWEALLMAVRRAAAWAEFYDHKLSEVEDDDQLRPGESAHVWLESAERVNEKLARWSKMAIDAGVARILVERAQTEGAQIARVLNIALGEMGFDSDTERRMRGALRKALEAVAREDTGVVEGSADEGVTAVVADTDEG